MSAEINILPLSRLPLGKAASVVSLPFGNSAMTRLRELGILPQTLIKVIRRAPMGDPLEVSVRGCLLSLRESEAALIDVSLDPLTISL